MPMKLDAASLAALIDAVFGEPGLVESTAAAELKDCPVTDFPPMVVRGPRLVPVPLAASPLERPWGIWPISVSVIASILAVVRALRALVPARDVPPEPDPEAPPCGEWRMSDSAIVLKSVRGAVLAGPVCEPSLREPRLGRLCAIALVPDAVRVEGAAPAAVPDEGDWLWTSASSPGVEYGER